MLIDQDGDIDVLVAASAKNTGAGANKLCINGGSNTFVCSNEFGTTPASSPATLQVADIDNDGDFDVVQGLLAGTKIWTNDGSIYFNPSDMEHPIAFNVLEKVDVAQQHLIASGLIGIFKKIWADSWGPRLEYILRNAILALLDYPGSTLLGIMRILTDNSFRKKVVNNITDQLNLYFL